KELAWEAGKLTLGYFQTGVRPEWKGDDSPVTIADRGAEELIRKRIEAKYPDHAILGEEFAAKESAGASHRWIIDPIDGTKSFIRGSPLYGVLVCLEIDGEPAVGVANFPGLNEMVYAANGLGCYWNGRRTKVSNCQTLDRAMMTHIDAASFERYPGKGEAFSKLSKATYYNMGACDAYGYALVATGRMEISCDPIVNSYDIAPFLPIMREAGGYCGDWKGNETIHAGEALATTKTLLPQVLAAIKS
ncbi:MAG: inositol monophosphatase family protein, partial [Chloroflexota bacterium]